jgi:neurotransmitter:Na+ symporter, NSS family
VISDSTGAAWVVARGVRSIERVRKLLMPALIILVIVLTVRAVTLPGAERGLEYLFSVEWSNLGKPS